MATRNMKTVIKFLSTLQRQPTAAQMVSKWKKKFKNVGIEDYKLSAEYLVGFVCGKRKVFDKQLIKAINFACQKRIERMPVQYIIGEWQFRTVKLIMRAPVFIPRPETEDLIDLIINSLCGNRHTLTFIDMCCGSGAISVSLLKENPKLQGYAIDILPEAIELAKENSIRNNVSERLQIIQSSIKDTIHNLDYTGFDFIVSNPPYIPTGDIVALQPEITKYEAHCALDGGEDGLSAIKEVMYASNLLLKPLGLLWLETGLQQDIPSLVTSSSNLLYVKGFPDYTGRFRFHLLQKSKTIS